jgi:hypothetical protein
MVVYSYTTYDLKYLNADIYIRRYNYLSNKELIFISFNYYNKTS